MKKIVKITFAFFIIIIIASIYYELESTNPKAFFNKHILSNCQEYLDQNLGSGTTRVDYMTWNKHAEHEPESKFFVYALDVKNNFYFRVYLDKKNKPVKTDYYETYLEKVYH